MGEHRSKKAVPPTFYNRKHLNGWAKIPIPKQIEDEHIEKKMEKYWGTAQVGTLYTLDGKGQGSKIRKGIVQKYTASIQQIDYIKGQGRERVARTS